MKYLTSAAAALLLLAACADEKAGNALFEQTINRYNEQAGLCLPLMVNVQYPLGRDAFRQVALGSPEITIAEVDQSGNRINPTALKQMDLLEREGFYEKESVRIPLSSKNPTLTDAARYTLTEQGQNQSRPAANGMPRFCIGREEVQKVTWYSEPNTSNGNTSVRVSYEARFIPETWLAKLLESGGGKLPLDEVRAHNTTVVQTDDGWKDERELAQAAAKQ